MDSGDDFELFAHPENTTPSSPLSKMKRLKKLSGGLLKESVETDVVLLVDAFGGAEDVFTRPGDETGLDVEVEGEDMDECGIKIETAKESVDVEREFSAKRVLDFDDDVNGGGGGEEEVGEVELGIDGKGLDADEGNENGTNKGKKRKKGFKSDDDGEELDSGKAASKRRSEKERSEYLNWLHYESQRLLRETRDAVFKPAPVVHKPISSVLEKIRMRKLELLKNTVNCNYTCNAVDDDGDNADDLKFLEGVLKLKVESVHIGGKMDDGQPNQVSVVEIRDDCEVECGFKEASVAIQEATNEKPTSSLRAPVCDTQDLFCDSDTSNSMNGIPGKIAEDASASEENFVPSVLTMNLRFDSAPPDDDDCDDDVYSDEEDNDKENVAPCHPMPRGDLVQAFVDDEAVEEDDSDNDQLRFQENEDEDGVSEDADYLDEMIATDYEENQTDQEKRRELHMKMLEQQDAEGIDNLLQKYKCESNLSKPDVLSDEHYIGEDESCDEALENEAPKNSLRLCVKKAKQMILHMFTDNDDPYVSSEDEELDTRVVDRVFRKYDEKKKIITPDQDESSREVFGMIKKLNIASEMKKKTKISSFDMITSKSISSSKPSFLHRSSSNSLPSSRKHGSSVTRAFVFARDDSNSRSSIAVSEESDTAQNKVQPTAHSSSTTKFSRSQSKQKPKYAMETVAGSSSLCEILWHSAAQQHNRDGIVKSTNSVFDSFKLPKRSKIEGMI